MRASKPPASLQLPRKRGERYTPTAKKIRRIFPNGFPFHAGAAMKLLCCHPSGLMYTKCFLRLEPLGLELAAAAARRAGHDVRLLDLQASTHKDFFRTLEQDRPDALCFGVNYLANIPEVIDLAKAA